MDVRFIAGFGPITREPAAGLGFWRDAFSLDFEEVGPDYFHARDLPGANVFGLWPLAQAAEAVFGRPDWPGELPVPQAWIEFELDSPAAVEAGAIELQAGGHGLLAPAREEPWGQTTARLQSPEGLLVGLSYLPQFHEAEPSATP